MRSAYFLSEGPDDFVLYNLATKKVCNYLFEKLTSVKQRKNDDRPVLPVLVPADFIHWLLCLTRTTVFHVQTEYKRYCGLVCDDTDPWMAVPAEVVKKIDNMSAQKTLSESAVGFVIFGKWSLGQRRSFSAAFKDC